MQGSDEMNFDLTTISVMVGCFVAGGVLFVMAICWFENKDEEQTIKRTQANQRENERHQLIVNVKNTTDLAWKNRDAILRIAKKLKVKLDD